MDMGSIAAAIGGLKAASDITQAMVGVRDTAILQAKTIELQQVILAAQASGIAAQSEQFTFLERIRDLEEELTSIKAWGAEKERYKLNEIKSGVFTYILKEEAGTAEPSHQICANCYDNLQRKSILQTEIQSIGRAEILFCHHCGSEIYIRGMRHTEHGQRRKPTFKI